MPKPKIIIIAGATASGKTDLAIQIAKQFNGEVISADSRTIYREMNIGTAKPEGKSKALPQAQKKDISDLFSDKPLMVDGVEHWGFNLVDPDDSFTAAQFKEYAEHKIKSILKRGRLPILAGGTGLYLEAVVDNLSFTSIEPNLELRKQLEQLSNEELFSKIEEQDPETADTIDQNNRRRLIRAIEILKMSGKPLSKNQNKGQQKYEALMLAIDVDRELLYERIDERVDKMIAEGLVDEVRSLKEKYGCEVNAMTGIGYRQICAFLSGYMKLADAIEILKQDTRHYAKRQLTWFRRDSRFHWIKNSEEAMTLVKEFLA